MNLLHLTLLIAALVCFLLAAWSATSPFWQKLVAAGLACLTGSFLTGRL